MIAKQTGLAKLWLFLLFFGCVFFPIQGSSQVTKPDLSHLPTAERRNIESACSSAYYGGPARYYSCLRRQLQSLQASAGPPDLSHLPTAERRNIESACSSAYYGGPARHYSCLRRQLQSLQASSGPPDLSHLPTAERRNIESACSSAYYGGPARHYSCLRRQLQSLQASSGRPDLSQLPAEERRNIEAACSSAYYGGPARHYSCLRQQARAIGYELPTVRQNDPRANPKTTTKTFTRKPAYNRDVLRTQKLLSELGYELGLLDGIYGTRTKQAIAAYQRDIGKTADGKSNAIAHRIARKYY